ncbi:MAG: hypothetical protein EBE86_016940 [Hormoscilla sp. GUM202]|nr:hypothetical protein [Hormoscilla sp. GUM202]
MSYYTLFYRGKGRSGSQTKIALSPDRAVTASSVKIQLLVRAFGTQGKTATAPALGSGYLTMLP